MIFQQFNLVPRIDVLTNVLLGRLNHALDADEPAQHVQPRRARSTRSRALDRLDIAQTALQRAGTLSGGQQQRVAIARALMQSPKIILADEPIASLDPRNAQIVMDSLKAINEQQGITVITNLHTLDTARAYCKRIIGMAAGQGGVRRRARRARPQPRRAKSTAPTGSRKPSRRPSPPPASARSRARWLQLAAQHRLRELTGHPFRTPPAKAEAETLNRRDHHAEEHSAGHGCARRPGGRRHRDASPRTCRRSCASASSAARTKPTGCKNYACLADHLTRPTSASTKVSLFPAADYDGVIQGLLGGTIDVAELGASGYAGVFLKDPKAVTPVLTTQQTDGSTGYYSVGLALKKSSASPRSPTSRARSSATPIRTRPRAT